MAIVVEATNDDEICRLCGESPPTSLTSRYPTVATVALLPLMLLMILCCRTDATDTGVQTTLVAIAAAARSPSANAALSPVADRPPKNGGRAWLASLPRRDDSSVRCRRGAVHRRRALIAGLGAASLNGTGRRTTEVVNKLMPPTTAGMNLAAVPAADRVNAASVITAPGGRRLDGLGRIQIRSTSQRRRSSFGAVFHAVVTSFRQPDNGSSSSSALIAAATGANQLGSWIRSDQSSSTERSRNDSDADRTSAANDADADTPSGVSEKHAAPASGGGHEVRRRARRSGVESVEDVGRRSESSGPLNASTASTVGTPTERPNLTTAEAQSVAVPLGVAALRYRVRGNFAALVDPVKSGRVSGSAANKWRRLGTASNNLTSASSPPADETTPVSATSSYNNISADSDTVEVKVLQRAISQDSADVSDSVSVGTQTLNSSLQLNDSEPLHTTPAPPVEWNCSKTTKNGLGLQAALKLRVSDSTVALCVYSLSGLFALVAAWAIIGVVFSLCVRTSHFARSSQMVLGFVAVAAATRALNYVAAEYQLLAAVATPGGRLAIRECWFPFVAGAFFVRQRGEDVTQEKRRHIKRDSCVFGLVFCSYLKLVFVLCLLIELCVVPVESLVLLRFVFVLFAVSLSAANVHKLATSSGSRVVIQLVLRALFAACAAFSAVDAAALLSDDFALLFRRNADVLVAVKSADRLTELFLSVVLCADSVSIFTDLKCDKSPNSENTKHKDVLKTRTEKKKASNLSRTRRSWLSRRLQKTSTKSKVVDVCSAPAQVPLGVIGTVGWISTEDPDNVDSVTPLPPPPSRVPRSRSMLYNDHGFIRFRLDGDTTDGDSDARTLDDDDAGGPGQARSVPASEYASAESLSVRRGPSSAGTPHWSRPGSPSLAGFRAPSIHLQDSIDRALDRCDIWRVGRQQGQLSVDELRRIVQLYADVGNQYRRRTAGTTPPVRYAEV